MRRRLLYLSALGLGFCILLVWLNLDFLAKINRMKPQSKPLYPRPKTNPLTHWSYSIYAHPLVIKAAEDYANSVVGKTPQGEELSAWQAAARGFVFGFDHPPLKLDLPEGLEPSVLLRVKRPEWTPELSAKSAGAKYRRENASNLALLHQPSDEYVPVEVDGECSFGFERSLFRPETYPEEDWWFSFQGKQDDRPLEPIEGKRIHVSGFISSKGPHGHLGGYDRELRAMKISYSAPTNGSPKSLPPPPPPK